MPTTLEEAICIIEQLQAENAALQAENAALKQQITELTEHLAPAHQPEAKARPRIKASVPKREPKPRRKRDPQHNRGRKRQEPTRIETHACDVSIGEITRLLHQVRTALDGDVETIKAQARDSPVLYADETGWREDGQNGYIWAFSTPVEEAVRYYE
jgi:hypothetical protein